MSGESYHRRLRSCVCVTSFEGPLTSMFADSVQTRWALFRFISSSMTWWNWKQKHQSTRSYSHNHKSCCGISLLLLPLSPQAALEMFYIWVFPWLHLGETKNENTRAPAHNHKWCCGIFASIATVTTGSVWNVSHLGVFRLLFAESSLRGYCKRSLALDSAATYLTAVTALCQWTIVVCIDTTGWNSSGIRLHSLLLSQN